MTETISKGRPMPRLPWCYFAAGAAIVLASVFVGSQSYFAVQQVKQFYSVNVRGLSNVGEVGWQLQEGRRITVYALTTDDLNLKLAYIGEARDIGLKIEAQLTQMAASPLDGQTREALAGLRTSRDSYLRIRDEIISAILLGHEKKALAQDLGEARPAFDRVRAAWVLVERALDRSASQRAEYVSAALYRAITESALLLIGMLFFLRKVGNNLARCREYESLRAINIELERTQRTLHERELHLRTIFEVVPDGIVSLDDLGVIESANPAAETLFGYGAADMIGRNVSLLMPPPDRQNDDGELSTDSRTAPGNISASGHKLQGQRKDGSLFQLELSIGEIAAGGRTRFVWLIRDVTERQKTEEALQKSRRQLLDVTANIPGAVFQLERAGRGTRRYLFVSEGIENLIGRTPREIVDVPGLMLAGVHPDDLEAAQQELIDAVNEGVPFHSTYRIQINGDERWLTSSAIPQEQASGEPLWNGVIVDVTANKEAERKVATYVKELAAAVANAEAATKAKSEFLATMSHEIRTPMNGVIGMTELLVETPLTSEQRDLAETIRASGESLLAIINDILDFSKIEAGKLDLEYCPLDIRTLVEDALVLVAPQAHRKQLELCSPFADDVPATMIGDAARLRQIVLNLLSNAIKFTDHGEVVLSVSREAISDSESVRVRFEIRDTGIGISPEAQSRLFKSFSQADSSTTRRFGGTGLGLAISKRLVELMGGEIGVRTSLDAGSTFWFIVPFHTTDEALGVLPPVSVLSARRVLAVDDNATNRSVIRQQLSKMGMLVDCAADGEEALQLMAAAARNGRPYELAILDFHMPRMNGLSLAMAMREEEAGRLLPIMMLTSDREREDVAAARAIGVKLFLLKPVRLASLLASVGEMFGIVPAARRQAALVATARQSGSVLVVEDNQTNQRVIVLRLEKLGCTVAVAANGVEAVRAAAATAFDVILMDCQMPGMDGFQATAEIRKRGGRRVPIVALTANAMDGERVRCLEAGMDDYLSKPVRVEELVGMLRRWIGPAAEAQDVPGLREGIPGRVDVREHSALELDLQQFVVSMEEEGVERAEIDSLFASFLTTSALLMSNLEGTLSTRDQAVLAYEAHALKGSFATFGLKSLVNLASQIEREGELSQWVRANEVFGLASTLYSGLRDHMIQSLPLGEH